jgi:pentatricopeptide repeat protein
MVEQKKGYLLIFCLTLARVNGFQSTPQTKRIRQSLGWSEQRSNAEFAGTISIKMVSSSASPRSKTSPSSRTRSTEKKIVRLGRSGKTEEALALYYEVEKPSTRLLNSAIDACSRARPTRLQEAFTIFDRAVEENGIRPNEFTFGALMNVCNRARNSDKAIRLLRSFEVRWSILRKSV